MGEGVRYVRFLFAFWIEVIGAVLGVVLWPLLAIARRAKRERWTDPR